MWQEASCQRFLRERKLSIMILPGAYAKTSSLIFMEDRILSPIITTIKTRDPTDCCVGYFRFIMPPGPYAVRTSWNPPKMCFLSLFLTVLSRRNFPEKRFTAAGKTKTRQTDPARCRLEKCISGCIPGYIGVVQDLVR